MKEYKPAKETFYERIERESDVMQWRLEMISRDLQNIQEGLERDKIEHEYVMSKDFLKISFEAYLEKKSEIDGPYNTKEFMRMLNEKGKEISRQSKIAAENTLETIAKRGIRVHGVQDDATRRTARAFSLQCGGDYDREIIKVNQ